MWNWYIGYCDGAYEARAWRLIPPNLRRKVGAIRECITERGRSTDAVAIRLIERLKNSKLPGENNYSHVDEHGVSAFLSELPPNQEHSS